ncbi:hypothetical protein GCM10025868_20830 [Angustibacter aerolatus]|uniref:Uncharacterized protein n=1 Tax=Angustibacter aerolatus TaxID=1162965 RepID=A0ABQ6JF89_9ACTN|nr:hypothetical protein [Angustibacter aerolatus]GMA86833.1 hypothetical protein GCM10025868_20830 [Angustibacter aerolatus]
MCAAGSVITLVAVVRLLTSDRLDLTWVLLIVVGVPLIVIMARFPLVLSRGETGLEVSFESAALLCLACFHGGTGALGIFALGQARVAVTTAKRWDVRAFNVGISVVSGALAVTTMRALSPLDETSLHELVAVSLGCAIYFLTDYVVSAVSIGLERRTSLLAEMRQNNGVLAGVLFVAIDSLGYLMTIVLRGLPPWASVLMAVPVLTILVATRSISRGAEHQRRLTALFGAAAEPAGRAVVRRGAGDAGRAGALRRRAGARRHPRHPARSG